MRKTLMIFGYKVSQPLYRQAYKTRPTWRLDCDLIQSYPADSLGQSLHQFLNKNNYELMQKFEDDDVAHVLTELPTTVLGEIAMQYYLWGNGKRSPYLGLVMLAGLLLYPSHGRDFWRAKRQGQQAHPFYREDFLRLLPYSVDDLRRCFNIRPYQP